MTRILLLAITAALPMLAQAARPVRGPEELKAFYAQNCVRCHGADGAALGPDGKRLKGADFTDAKGMSRQKDEALARTILKGTFFGLGMPAFKDQLSAEEALVLVKEVLRRAEKGRIIGAPPK